jgi:hypothetical protein
MNPARRTYHGAALADKNFDPVFTQLRIWLARERLVTLAGSARVRSGK